MPDGAIIQLPFQHYVERYRKAYSDLYQVASALGQAKANRAGLKQHIKQLEQQFGLLKQECNGAEIALRSAIINEAPGSTSDQGPRPGIPDAVVSVLKQEQLESLQPKPEPEKDPEAGA